MPNGAEFTKTMSPAKSPVCKGQIRGTIPAIPEAGLEPARSCDQGILSPDLCLTEDVRTLRYRVKSCHRKTTLDPEYSPKTRNSSPVVSPVVCVPKLRFWHVDFPAPNLLNTRV